MTIRKPTQEELEEYYRALFPGWVSPSSTAHTDEFTARKAATYAQQLLARVREVESERDAAIAKAQELETERDHALARVLDLELEFLS